MAYQGDKLNVRMFQDGILHLAQQKGSRLQDKVSRKPVNGEITYFDRMDQMVATKRGARNSDVTPQDAPFDRRAVKRNMYSLQTYIDRRDDINQAMDIRGPLVQQFGFALGRKMDEVILEAAVGNALSVDASLSESNVALGSSQVVDEDFDSNANSLLIVRKLREARRILDDASGMIDEKIYCITTADDSDSLLSETSVTSADYNSVRALVNGEVNTFMGFEFVKLHKDIVPDSSEGFKQLVCFMPSALGLAVAEDFSVSVDRIPEKHNDTLVQADMNIGAVRIEEEKVVVIESYRA